MSKIGLFGKLFKKKDNPVSPDPVVSAPSKPVISTKTDNFKVAGISSYMDNLMELAYENDDYEKTKKQIVDDFMYDEKIFQYDFLVSKVELIPEPENEYDSNAVKVLLMMFILVISRKGVAPALKIFFLLVALPILIVQFSAESIKLFGIVTKVTFWKKTNIVSVLL